MMDRRKSTIAQYGRNTVYYQWRENPLDKEQIIAMARELNQPRFLIRLLAGRGIHAADQAHTFLFPRLAELPDPFHFRQMTRATALVDQTLAEKEPVVVFGDYDADGVTGTVLLVEFFRLLGLKTLYHVPDRIQEGYGINAQALYELRARAGGHSPLLVTVDNGIAAKEEIREAQRLGFRVLITDHHQASSPPDAEAVLNPALSGSGFPYPHLSGVGVAFFLIWAVRNHLAGSRGVQRAKNLNLKRFLDLVALGTVADVMPLTGVNRILVRAGLEAMAEVKRPGLVALCRCARVDISRVTSEDIGFRLAPRINGCGRVGDPKTAVELLLSRTPEQAGNLAAMAEQCNETRKQEVEKALQSARVLCRAQAEENIAAPVVHGPDFHLGVVGIVAARLCEEFDRPVLVVTRDGHAPDQLRGSGRSVEGIDLYRAVDAASAKLLGHGGHPMAVGIRIAEADLREFQRELSMQVELQDRAIETSPYLVDAELDQGAPGDRELLHSLRMLGPFGPENPEPLFLIRRVSPRDVRLIQEIHLSFRVPVGPRLVRGIGFGLAQQWHQRFQEGGIDILCRLSPDRYTGIQVQAVDIFATA